MTLLKKIIIFINLLGTSKLEKQVAEVLIYLRDVSSNTKSRFTEEDLLKSLISSKIEKKRDTFFETDFKPLKSQDEILEYLVAEGYLDKYSKAYVLTAKANNKIYDIENKTNIAKKIFSIFGTIGGSIYLLSLIFPIIINFINKFTSLLF